MASHSDSPVLAASALPGRLIRRSRREQATCAEHGPFEALVTELAGREVRSPCPRCAARENAARVRELTRPRPVATGVPERYAGRGLAGLWNEPPGLEQPELKSYRLALAAARGMVSGLGLGEGRGLVLYGPLGTGKTSIACAIIEQLNSPTLRARYMHSSAFTRQVRDASWRRSQGEMASSQIMDDIAKIDVWLLDDVGANSINRADGEVISEIIEMRYSAKKPTIITTNLDPSSCDDEGAFGALTEYLGPRAASRLGECCKLVKCDWQNLRPTARAESTEKIKKAMLEYGK